MFLCTPASELSIKIAPVPKSEIYLGRVDAEAPQCVEEQWLEALSLWEHGLIELDALKERILAVLSALGADDQFRVAQCTCKATEDDKVADPEASEFLSTIIGGHTE